MFKYFLKALFLFALLQGAMMTLYAQDTTAVEDSGSEKPKTAVEEQRETDAEPASQAVEKETRENSTNTKEPEKEPITWLVRNTYNPSSKKEIIGKIGTTYAYDLEKFGLNAGAYYYYRLDPYFAVGGSGEIFWVRWEKTLGTKAGPVDTEVIEQTNAINLPLYLNASIRLPFLAEYIFVKPALNVGVGLSTMMLTYNQPAFTSTDGKVYEEDTIFRMYAGFTWQVVTSFAYHPSEDSNIEFLLETGYRGNKVQNGEEKIDMSGILLNAGVRFYLSEKRGK